MKTYLDALKAPKERWQTRGWRLRRKPWLGHYNATREQWYKIWRIARLKYQAEIEANYSDSLECKALTILMVERSPCSDRLHQNTLARRNEYNLTVQIVEELKAEGKI